ncbi:MAG: bifunctional phosphoglucose/phosphomannose isomerase [Chloroflexota bacterium]
MNLDDLDRFRALDPGDMLGHIEALPGQLEAAWDLGSGAPLPGWTAIERVLVCGMGGSAIGGDLLAAYAAPLASVPVIVWRNYGLPAYASGPGTLVIASSHSGNTEELLAAFDEALRRGVRLVAVSRGGELGRRAEAARVPWWRFKHAGQPRAAVGFSFGLLLALLARLGLIPDPSTELQGAVAAMRKQQETLTAKVPVVNNPAKRMAGQLFDRWVTVLGADHLAPVARRWRTQVSEIGKALGQFEELPEADHNLVAGVVNPQRLVSSTKVVFLQANQAHPRNRLRIEATRQALMVEGFDTDIIEAPGATRLAQQWTALHFGDYTAYYLAMAYGVDPTPVAAIEGLKRRLAG